MVMVMSLSLSLSFSLSQCMCMCTSRLLLLGFPLEGTHWLARATGRVRLLAHWHPLRMQRGAHSAHRRPRCRRGHRPHQHPQPLPTYVAEAPHHNDHDRKRAHRYRHQGSRHCQLLRIIMERLDRCLQECLCLGRCGALYTGPPGTPAEQCNSLLARLQFPRVPRARLKLDLWPSAVAADGCLFQCCRGEDELGRGITVCGVQLRTLSRTSAPTHGGKTLRASTCPSRSLRSPTPRHAPASLCFIDSETFEMLGMHARWPPTAHTATPRPHGTYSTRPRVAGPSRPCILIITTPQEF